jgi:glycosyltransferase involved in cell wall biosynthesis
VSVVSRVSIVSRVSVVINVNASEEQRSLPAGQPTGRPQRMKIALVVHDLHVRGGHSAYTKILADELSRRHEVMVFANSCEGAPGARWQTTHVRAWRTSALACVQTFPLGLRLHSGALDGYEIRHAQGYCGGRPNVVTAHICVAAYLQSLRGVALRHRLSLQMMADTEARFYRRYEGRVIAISHRVARELKEFYGFNGPLAVIPHGVEAQRFSRESLKAERESVRRQLNVSEDETLALYVGDLTKAHLFLKQLALVAPAVRLAIVTYSKAYRWQAPNVSFLPPTETLERYYAAADAFVFPTTYDAFGMVVLEAMAAGLAVFCSDRAGASELIDAGRDGLITPLDEWVETTAEHLRNRALLRRIGRAAEQTARRHEWAGVVGRVEQLYSEISGS